jgi:opacity protein-like surface antigen
MGDRGKVAAGILALAVSLAPAAAHAVDEIQVYNAEIAETGQWTLQQHLNYAINGRREPDFPGGLIPHHALNGTPELAYGVTEWFELGWYAPFAVDQNGDFHSNGAKIRTLFVTPNAAKREVFYGVNIEYGYATPLFSETRFNVETRSSTSASATTATPSSRRPRVSRASSSRTCRSASNTTRRWARSGISCRSPSSSTTSTAWSISRSASSTSISASVMASPAAPTGG